MAYIIKNTSGLVNTRVTDTGRLKLSQGNFNIKYFQIGDSEVSYDVLPTTYNQSKSFILEPPFNTQNSSGVPQSNRQAIKYPYYVDNIGGNTYGIPFMDSGIDSVYNRAPLRGFFSGDTTATTINWSALTNTDYVVSANYIVDMSTLSGGTEIELIYSGCDTSNDKGPSVGDFVTIYYDGMGQNNCECTNLPPTTTTTTTAIPCGDVDCITVDYTIGEDTYSEQVNIGEGGVYEFSGYTLSCSGDTWGVTSGSTEILATLEASCDCPLGDYTITEGSVFNDFSVLICTTTTTTDPCLPPPTTTTTTTCVPPPPVPTCPQPPKPGCTVSINSCYSIFTYRITSVCGNRITLDRSTPIFNDLLNSECFGRVIIYPPNITTIYDSITPRPHWPDDVINFESICDTDQFDVKIWNMNIPWTESPAGLNPTTHNDFTKFGSIDYIGSKEFFGYTSSKGQIDTDSTYYYNSFSEKVIVTPEEQKAVAIIHYTNQTIDFFYGEKFALEPFDPTNPDDTTGQARNFKLHIPWLMWHKNPNCCNGQTFWVDPPGFDDKNLFQVHHIESTKNDTMNQPGIRYYHLWDDNPNTNGIPNRIGKVFPDSKLVIIDDEEIIAAMSYKSNRNWTLPAPQVSLITPNTCGTSTTNVGVLTGNSQTMFVTYRFTNNNELTNSLHSNYYTKIVGNNNECNPNVSQNVAIRFGNEFPCLAQPVIPTTTTTTTEPCYIITEDLDIITTNDGDNLIWCDESGQTTTTTCPTYCNIDNGFSATKLEIICQKVNTGNRPISSMWKIIDYTDLISANTVNGYITASSLTGTTFIISDELYNSAPYYDLSNYIDITSNSETGVTLNFGDEYYFYGSLETDIQATIYEMKYKINLSNTEFKNTSNPTWTLGNKSYVTEIALLDDNKDVLVMSKLQSPTLRQGIQQFVIKIDF
jgi:hypothetical protein